MGSEFSVFPGHAGIPVDSQTVAVLAHGNGVFVMREADSIDVVEVFEVSPKVVCLPTKLAHPSNTIPRL